MKKIILSVVTTLVIFAVIPYKTVEASTCQVTESATHTIPCQVCGPRTCTTEFCETDVQCTSKGGTPQPPRGDCEILWIGTCSGFRSVSCQAPGSLRCCISAAACTAIGGTPVTTPPPAGGSTIPVYDPGCSGEGFSEGVKTALGCLPTEPQQFTNRLLPWAVFLGAGIAFLLGIFGSLMIVLSAGNPEKMQAGKEMITSAIGGLILIIFAVFLLRFIGVDILGLFEFRGIDTH